MKNRSEEYTVLFVDDDQILSDTITKCLSALGYQVVRAADGRQALDVFSTTNPSVIIADLHMPVMNGLDFLAEVKKIENAIPVIITTGYPDIDTAITAIHHGAFDYIVKPFQLELLHQKIQQAIRTTRLTRENAVLSELASLHEITNLLTKTRDLDGLLDEMFKYCLEVGRTDTAVIHMFDRKNRLLFAARQKGFDQLSQPTSCDDWTHFPAAKWSLKFRGPMLTASDVAIRTDDSGLKPESSGFILTVPLFHGDEGLGVITLERQPGGEPFSLVDLNLLTVLGSHASIAISNAQLYGSLNQKVDELSIISSFSERLMGLMEWDAIIECLFDTVRRQFRLDVIAFLTVQKRRNILLYWSREQLPSDILNGVTAQLVDAYNSTSKTPVNAKKIVLKPVGTPPEKGGVSIGKLEFHSVLPIAWEDFHFGTVYFASARDVDNRLEVLAILSSLVNQTRIALTNEKLYTDIKENYIRTIKALAIAVDAKDTYTHGHSENVMNIAEAIARELNMDEKGIGVIRDAGLLHDIGKIGIPGMILNKPGPLTYEEFNGIMKTHSTLGANIVRDVPFLQDLYELILHHHEHHDGSGYPDGLKGEDIPFGARILHVADAFEAMTSNRPYRTSLGSKEAMRRLIEGKGKQFDPAIVDAMVVAAGKKGWLEEKSTK